jgi:hypothetical protein
MLMAGGDTEVGGNGSVYWRARHYDDDGQSKRKLKCKPKDQKDHKNDEIDVDGDNAALGRDEATAATAIGARVGQRGSFVVKLRYRTRADWEAALKEVEFEGDGPVVVKLKVPAITTRKNANEDPPFEVKVEW